MNGYIDIYNGQLMLFTGNDMIEYDNISFGTKIENDKISNKYAISRIVGILHLSSEKIITTGKSGIIRKEMTPFFKCLPKIIVKTKKTSLIPDEYIIANVEYIENNIIYCNVETYLGINPSDELLLKSLSICHWNKKYDKEFELLKNYDNISDRIDLTHLNTYSIDPIGCEDIDDAIHCIQMTNGYEFGIHIADVSSYIDENSKFDEELSRRVSSIYIEYDNIKRYDMIPSKLSIDNISLRENINKRVFSIIVRIDEDGKSEIKFCRSVIKVRKNMSYEEFEKCKDDDIFKDMYEIGKKIYKNYDEYDSHKMVEAYMIFANKSVAEYISKYDSENVLLRTHENTNQKQSSDKLYNKYLISHMEKAIYKIGTNKSRHDTLNLDFYTHFTSPIRRYADILIHRQLQKILNKQKINNVIVDKLFIINTYTRWYKIIERYAKILKMINDNDFNENMECTIVNIKYNNIRIYIEKYDVEIDVELIDKKIVKLYSIEYNMDDINSYIKIIDQKGDIVIYKLFEKLNIKIIINKKTFEKINVVFL